MILKVYAAKPVCSLKEELLTKMIKLGVTAEDKISLFEESLKGLMKKKIYPFRFTYNWVEHGETTRRPFVSIIFIFGVTPDKCSVGVLKDRNTLSMVVT